MTNVQGDCPTHEASCNPAASQLGRSDLPKESKDAFVLTHDFECLIVAHVDAHVEGHVVVFKVFTDCALLQRRTFT